MCDDVIKPNTTYYPIISLYELGQMVVSLDITDNSNPTESCAIKRAI